MKTFLLIETQSGGCDYTIGCGVRITTIQAESMEAAQRHAKGVDEDGMPILWTEGEYRIESAELIEVASRQEINLTQLEQDRKKAAAEQAQRRREAQERADYKRLRAKFEGK